MIPPKDPYIQVKALRSEVPMMVGSKVMHFARDSIHFVRRVDVEGLIREVGGPCHLAALFLS